MDYRKLIGPLAFMSVFLTVFGIALVVTANPKKPGEEEDMEG